MFKWLKNQAEKRRSGNKIYYIAANHARHPSFFQTYQVSDSITGRYEMLCIHIYLILERLRNENKEDDNSQNKKHRDDLGEALTEAFVRELEQVYKEQGLSDQDILKNVNKLFAGFYERASAYKAGVRGGNEADLAQAINHYVYTGATNVDKRAENMAAYTLKAHEDLQPYPIEDIERGNFTFLSPDRHYNLNHR